MANHTFLQLSGYFDGDAQLKPLLHTWSLSVEEQYYLVFPLIVMVSRRSRAASLRSMLAVLGVASLVLSAWLVEHDDSSAFYLAPSRAFELLLGSTLACSSGALASGFAREALGAVGLVAITASFLLFDPQVPFPGTAALLPCAGTACLIGAGAQTSAGRFLSLRPLQFFGDLSYSLYLWHWPLLVFARYRQQGGVEPDLTERLACIGVAICLAALSMHLVERPLLDERRSAFPYLRLGLAAMLVASVACFLLYWSDGAPGRFPPEARTLFAAAGDHNPRRSDCHLIETPLPYDQYCVFGSIQSAPDTLVWGDSHGAELVVALGERLEKLGRAVLQITASACPPSTTAGEAGSFCRNHNEATLASILIDRRIRTVILTANFSEYRGPNYDALLQGYEHVVRQLCEHGKHVVLIDPIPTMDFDPPSVIGRRVAAGESLMDLGLDERSFQSRNERALGLLGAIAQALPVTRVSPRRLFCSDGRCRVFTRADGVLYFNQDHLSVTGARVLAKALPL